MGGGLAHFLAGWAIAAGRLWLATRRRPLALSSTGTQLTLTAEKTPLQNGKFPRISNVFQYLGPIFSKKCLKGIKLAWQRICHISFFLLFSKEFHWVICNFMVLNSK
jgi:hypothetical protein